MSPMANSDAVYGPNFPKCGSGGKGTAHPRISVLPEGYSVDPHRGLCSDYCLFLSDNQPLHLHLSLSLPR